MSKRNRAYRAYTDPASAHNRRSQRRLLTIRASMNPSYLWSAICSECPDWKWSVRNETYRVFAAAVRIHRIIHARAGQVVAS